MSRKNNWIEKYGKAWAFKQWLKENPPPPDWKGTPEEWAYEEGPIDFPLEPEEEPEEIPVPVPSASVSREEFDALRERVTKVSKGFNKAIKKNRETVPDPAPPPVPPTPSSKKNGLASILAPLARRK